MPDNQNSSERLNPPPVFGEWLRGIYASERNPQRDGMYVRTIRRTGRTNPGTYYELTDGKGSLWSYPVQSVERTPKPAPAMLNGVEGLRIGDCRLINGEWWTCNDPRDGKFVRFQGSHEPTRAADNRGAAGVEGNGPDLYSGPHAPCIHPKRPPAAVPAGEAVAYLDIGVGGYLDLGTEKDADELFKLPPGRHMLGIIGTYGVDGYKANPPAAEAPTPVQAAPQPADGGAVAWRTRHRDVDWSFTTRPHPRDLAAGIWEPLYTHPPAAQVQGVAAYDRELIARMLDDHARGIWVTFTPDAMREQAALLRDADNAEAAGVHTAHPSACELGAVRELAREMRHVAAADLANEPGSPAMRDALQEYADRICVALQHRGDSRGGEG